MTGERDALLSALLVLVEAEGSINPLCALWLLAGGRCLRGLIAPRALLPSSVIAYTPPLCFFVAGVLEVRGLGQHARPVGHQPLRRTGGQSVSVLARLFLFVSLSCGSDRIELN